MERAEGASEGDGGGEGGRGDSNDSFKVGGLEARGKSGLMKHRFGRQTASGDGSDRAKADGYTADDELKKAKSEENPLKKDLPLLSATQWIIGVNSGGQSNEAEREGRGGVRGAPADGDSRDPFPIANWGVSLQVFFFFAGIVGFERFVIIPWYLNQLWRVNFVIIIILIWYPGMFFFKQSSLLGPQPRFGDTLLESEWFAPKLRLRLQL